jgi:hypothetical protein
LKERLAAMSFERTKAMDLMILAPLGMFVVMGLLAAIGLPGSRRSWEKPDTPPARRPAAAPAPQQRVATLPPPPPGYGYAPMLGGGLALVPLSGGGR